jgi:hypothetical protein
MATVKTAQDTATFVDLHDGTSRVTLQYFYKTSADASEPTVPQGNFEYNFLSGVLTASVSTAFDNWSTIPETLSFSEALWMVSITLEGSTVSTATFDKDDWNGPVVLSRVGFQPTQPDPATSVATVFIFKAGASNTTAPTGNPSGDFTFTYATGNLSGGNLNGWSQDLPTVAPGNYVWVKQATASSTSTTDTIPASEFNASAATVLSGTGLDGYNTAVVQLYNKNSNASSAPADPTGSFKHTFSTGLLTAESGADFKGWTQSAPSITNGEYLWVIQGSAVSRGSTDLIAGSEFGAAQIVGVGGENALPLTVTDTDRDGLNQTITLSDGSTIVISDGNPATNEGVIVVYASNANGADKSLAPGPNLQYVRYYEWSGTKPTLSEIPNTNNGWVKYIGENATDSGVIPIYSPISDPDANTNLSLTLGSNTYVTFYEWTITKPTSVPSDAHTNTFVPFVAVSPTISTSYNATTGVTTVTVVDTDGSTNFDITDGDAGTSEGVTVIYANDSSGDGKNTVRQTGQEYVLYYEWVGIENKPNSDLSNLTGTLEWIKFVGETPNAPDAQGIIPIYANRANPTQDSHTFISYSTGRNWVTFLEYSGTRPTNVPSGTHEQTFVPFVGSNGDPAGRYSTFRAYSTTSTTPPSGTITWATGAVVLSDTTNWSLSAPEVAVSPSTTVYWSDLVFVDADGDAEYTTDTGSAVRSLISFNGVVSFTNTTAGSIELNNDGTPIPVLDPTSVGPAGSTVINGGRIDANTIKLSGIENSGGATTGDQSGMILSDDTITIQDSAGLTRVFIGKLS